MSLLCFEYVLFCLLYTRLPCRWYILWNYSGNPSAFRQFYKSAVHKPDAVIKICKSKWACLLCTIMYYRYTYNTVHVHSQISALWSHACVLRQRKSACPTYYSWKIKCLRFGIPHHNLRKLFQRREMRRCWELPEQSNIFPGAGKLPSERVVFSSQLYAPLSKSLCKEGQWC